MIWFHDIIQGLIVDSSCHSPAILDVPIDSFDRFIQCSTHEALPSLTISDLARGPPGAVFLPGN